MANLSPENYKWSEKYGYSNQRIDVTFRVFVKREIRISETCWKSNLRNLNHKSGYHRLL